MQDTTAPSGGLTINGGALYTNNAAVTLAPSGSDAGATSEWSSNWTSVNGVGTVGFPAANWVVDSAGSQLTADTSTCGATQCYAQTFFTHTIASMSNWPTFTAMFKTDFVNNLHFGVISASNSNTRFTLYAGSSTGFTSIEISWSAGTFGTYPANVPLSPNTWYYGQVVFPTSTIGEIYIWPAGQARPQAPTVYQAGLYMDHPGLNFWGYGDNGANLHHYSVANVNITSKDPDGNDIGAPALPGSTVGSGGTWTVQGAGSDIWGTSDQFQYAAESLPGDGNLSARVTSQSNTSSWAKAGLMLRASSDPGAAFYAVYDTPGNGVVVQDRPSQGASAAWPVSASGGLPKYLKVARAGTTFTAYTSSDGTNWTLISGSSLTLSGLSGTLLAGLAVTSHNASAVSTATFDTVQLTNGTNLPGCSSAWPCAGSGYGVYGMGFANDGTTWSCPAQAGGTWCVAAQRQTGWSLTSGDGRKTVSYRYIDNSANTSTTGSSYIILDTTPPTVSVTAPTSNHEVRGKVVVTASATDPTASDGTSSGVASVALYLDGVAAGTDLSGGSGPTFLLDTTNVTPGAHVLTARATDVAGNAGTSAGVTVIVSNTGEMPYETFATRDLPADGHTVGVNVGNGNTVASHQDLDIPGLGPDLSIARTYNALMPICTGLFGCGWTSDLDEGLVANGDGSVTYRDPDGGMHVFLPNGSGGYLTSPGLYLTLVKNGDSTYTLTAHDQTKTNFNAAGYVTSVVDRNGNALTVAYNGSSLPTTVTDAAGRQLTITTSGTHITSIAAPGSRTYGYAYDGNGNLTDYTDPATIVTHYTYDTTHRLTKVTLNYQSAGPTDQQTNVATSLTYDTSNRLVSLVDPLSYDVGFTYTDPTATAGGQTAVNQLQTNSTTTPSSSSSVYETTSYFLTTDAAAAVGQIIDPINQGTGLATQYQYDGNENLTQVTDPDGHVSTSTYDGNGNELTHVVDPGSGHLALTTTWTYDSANNALTETDPRGIVTQYTYDAPATGNLTKVVRDYVNNGPTDSQTNVTTTSTYDSHGEALTETDPTNVVTQYTYDTQGNVTQTIQNYKQGVNPDSQTNVTTSATYDALGQKLTSTDALGVVAQSTYDIRGNVMQTVANYKQGITPDSQTNVTTNYGYDQLGRQVTVTNPRGIVSQTTYDADGRVTKTVENYVSGGGSDSQTNVTTTTAYDAAGNATLGTDPKGNTTTTTFDADNRSTEVVVKSSPATGSHQVKDTKTTYDPAGLKLSDQVMDGNTNPTTSYTYDAANRLTQQQDPAAKPGASDQSGQPNITATTFDANGNATETKVTNAVAGTVSDTTAVFDKLNHQTSKTEQNGTSDAQTTTYAYDLDGRQTSLTDPKNNTTTTTYDALGRTLTATAQDGSQQAMTYDAAGKRLTQSNCGGTTGQTGKTIDTYDPLGRTASEQRQDCASAVQTTVTYGYDADGNKLQQTTSYAGGTQFTTNSTYDALDRLQATSDGTVGNTYDAAGNVTQMQALSGSNAVVTATMGYDGGNRLNALTTKVGPTPGTQLHSYSYSYDGNGNRTTVVEDGVTTTYSYDGDNQLTSLTSGGTTTNFTYDANHNRTSMGVVGSAATTYTYDSAEIALQSKIDPNGKVTTYTYDTSGPNGNEGNLVKAVYDPTGANQQTTYTYDTTNRLATMTKPDGTVLTFSYDADGNRTTKSVTSGSTTTTVKDVYQLGRLAYQTDGSGTLLASFTYDSNGVPVSVQVGSDPATAPRYYYVYNGHGDVVALTDALGNSVATYAYDGWGVPTTNTESFPGGWSNPYRYDGRDQVRYDNETGLYWMSVRAYDPTLGRFISRDPLNRAPLMGWADQPYAYAGNNPLVNVDPSGQRFLDQTADNMGASVAPAR